MFSNWLENEKCSAQIPKYSDMLDRTVHYTQRVQFGGLGQNNTWKSKETHLEKRRNDIITISTKIKFSTDNYKKYDHFFK